VNAGRSAMPSHWRVIYLKLGFGGAHTDSNQRLMYTSA
jgi:hypothetical protein